VSCAKTAEPIDLPFWLWTRVGRRSISSIVFARWRQCAVMGRHFGATWRIQMSRPSAAAMRLYVKLFLCMLPMSVARSSSGMLTIGRIAYQWEGGDGSAQRVRSVIYGCLVRYCSSIVTMSLSYTVYKLVCAPLGVSRTVSTVCYFDRFCTYY